MKYLVVLCLLIFAVAIPAQDILDFTEVRKRSTPRTAYSLLRLGGVFSFPERKDETWNKEDVLDQDSSFFYSNPGEDSLYSMFASRQGAYMSWCNTSFSEKGVSTLFEAWYRPWSLYREGYYSGGDFIPTLRYKGEEYRLRYGAMMPVNQAGTIFAQGTAYWGMSRFSRTSQTPNPVSQYSVPGDYQAMGARVSIEGGEVNFDRQTNLPVSGGKMTLWCEREMIDGGSTYGTPGWQSQMPDKFWRAGGLISWYKPFAGNTLTLQIKGRWFDDKDRVNIFDATNPPGQVWVHANLGWRWDMGTSFYIEPFIIGQYLQVPNEFGTSKKDEFFYGGGLFARYTLNQTFSIYVDYSYLQNAAREPISLDEYTMGEHRVYFGLDISW